MDNKKYNMIYKIRKRRKLTNRRIKMEEKSHKNHRFTELEIVNILKGTWCRLICTLWNKRPFAVAVVAAVGGGGGGGWPLFFLTYTISAFCALEFSEPWGEEFDPFRAQLSLLRCHDDWLWIFVYIFCRKKKKLS